MGLGCGGGWGVEVTCVGRYVAAVYGLRVQKIGPHYRVYKKVRRAAALQLGQRML